MKLQIIVGSTRPTRAADKVVPWVTGRAAQHEAFETEVLDLRDWPLPMFGEHMGSIGDPTDPTYSDEIVRRVEPEDRRGRRLPGRHARVQPQHSGRAEERDRQCVRLVRLPEQADGHGRL